MGEPNHPLKFYIFHLLPLTFNSTENIQLIIIRDQNKMKVTNVNKLMILTLFFFV